MRAEVRMPGAGAVGAMRYLSVCAIVRDEGTILREWACFYLALGVEHLYLYDNESRIPVAQTLAGLERWVTVTPIAGRFRQFDAYNDCLRGCQGQTRWLAAVDADEFVVPHRAQDLKIFLEGFESAAGVAINWQMFGPSGHATPPTGLAIEAFTKKLPVSAWDNRHVKTICQVEQVEGWKNPHYPIYRPGARAVNPEGTVVLGALCYPPQVERAQVNHYWTRSRSEWEIKRVRGRADVPTEYLPGEFERYEREASVEDRSAARFAERVRKWLERS